MACANLAHLFLARMVERRDEMAIREALGAESGHLVRQVLTESLLLAALGGAGGVGLGAAASRRLPFEHAAWQAPVWLFVVTLSAVAGVLFGLPACWQVLRERRLSSSARTIVRGRSRLGFVLLAAEVAMAFLVLSGAALLTRNFAALLDEPSGFESSRVLEIPNLPLAGKWDKLAPALRRLSGVQDVAAINSAPMSLGANDHTRFATRFGVQGRTFDPAVSRSRKIAGARRSTFASSGFRCCAAACSLHRKPIRAAS